MAIGTVVEVIRTALQFIKFRRRLSTAADYRSVSLLLAPPPLRCVRLIQPSPNVTRNDKCIDLVVWFSGESLAINVYFELELISEYLIDGSARKRMGWDDRL